MKQLLILSGKGGTGKTTVASALIAFSHSHAFADCDVDAPNLHLVMTQMADPIETDYFGFGKAVIDYEKCIQCGLCEKNCRFGAIKEHVVGTFECEGCGVCTVCCPVQAITLKEYSSGSLMLYKAEERAFSTAQLKMGSGASGKLVTAVKKQLLEEIANESFKASYESSSPKELIIIDGSPGIGCPVIASISGVDQVLIVAEPTLSGIHDMKRIMETAKHFGVPCTVCINKFDINTNNTREIESYCKSLEVPISGKIPFDGAVIEAINNCKSIACYPESPAAKAIEEMWHNIQASIK